MIELNTTAIWENTNWGIAENKEKIRINAEKIEELANPDPIPDTNPCVDDYTLETNEYCGEWAGATLGMLPLWGQAPSDADVYFQWPTQEIWDQMSPDVSLKSLDFATK